MADVAVTVKTLGERRIALVIGNAGYVAGPRLINTERDATGVADALHMLGFVSHVGKSNGASKKIEAIYDCTLIEMKRALADFSVAARNSDMAIFYYSGHGIEIDFKNYLIPVDATLSHVDRLAYEAVPLGEVISAVSKAQKLRLVILDACRDNPLVQLMKDFDAGKSGSTVGLGPPSSGISALTFYASAEGQKARQGPAHGRSPFAEALISRFLQPLELARVFGLVTDDVRNKTDGQQEPRLYGPPQRDDVFLFARPGRPAPDGEPLLVPYPRLPPSLDPKILRRRFVLRWSLTISLSLAAAAISAGTYFYLTKPTALVTYIGEDDFFTAAIFRAGLPENKATYSELQLEPEMFGRHLKLLSFSSFEGKLNDQDWQGVVQPDELEPPKMYLPRLIGPEFTDKDAVSGVSSLNFAPKEIPVVQDDTALTGMKHKVVFDVGGISKVWVRFDFKTNTNPRLADQHNCDSSLRVQSRFDRGQWKVHSVLCGRYPGEDSNTWARNMISFSVPPGAKSFELAMDFTIQNNLTAEYDRYFLIDNAMIIGEE